MDGLKFYEWLNGLRPGNHFCFKTLLFLAHRNVIRELCIPWINKLVALRHEHLFT
jgi:hypothetical protein